MGGRGDLSQADPGPGPNLPPVRSVWRTAAFRRPPDARSLAMLISGILAFALAFLAVALPAPYVIESPGPTINTLGEVQGKLIISIDGRESYPVDGALDMVTVYVNGGPRSSVGALDVFSAWVDPNRSVYPVELVYPATATREDITALNKAEMTGSQDAARAAALRFLNIPYTTWLRVGTAQSGSAAQGVLQPGDQIVSLDGSQVSDLAGIQAVLAQSQGAPVSVGIIREQQQRTVYVTPERAADGRYLLGIGLRYSYDFPFPIKFNLENVGGPSAGMMFALGTIDKLTPGDLTGGKHIAGTGTIDPSGKIGPIGGVVQKMISAKDAGAVLFLAPAGNCSELMGRVPGGLEVVRVSTLREAFDAVTTVASGSDTSGLPRCTS